jgi:predicted ATP-binding protein involved in virulence
MIKISSLELDDVKRIRAVKIAPTAEGLTIIGGNNNQGKTSVLDGIAWALGGDKYRPSNATREGSTVTPKINITLSNGLVVERSGANGSLKVIDSTGKRSGQTLLNSFISTFALDLPKFMTASAKEKADILLQIIGVGQKLCELENDEKTIYNRRYEIGRIADQKEKFAAEMPEYEDVPKATISPSELIIQQQDILTRNGENQRKRDRLSEILSTKNALAEKVMMLEQQLTATKAELELTESDFRTALKSVEQLKDESTEELENNIRDLEKINIKVRANLDKEKAKIDAKQYKEQYAELSNQIDEIRSNRRKLLDGAELPLPGLSVEGGELTYNGKKWDCMSGSEQLKVSVAIVRKLNPECGFVLLDKLEQMDVGTLSQFGAWLENEGLQAIATRVSTGDECSIIIEDGYGYNRGKTEAPREQPKT